MEGHKTIGFTHSTQYRCLEDLRSDTVHLGLLYCGYEQCEKGHSFGPNKRSSYVIHVVKDGSGSLTYNGRTWQLKAGDVFCLYPGMEAWYSADRVSPWTYFWVGFHGLGSEELLRYSGFNKENLVVQTDCIDQLQGCVEKILLSHQLCLENDLKRLANLQLFFAHLIEARKRCQKEGQNKRDYSGSIYIEQAQNYLNLNYNRNIRIGEIAHYIGIHRSYLSSSFKKKYGLSPEAYLLQLRMDKAMVMLRNTNKTIKEISKLVGYEDQLAFSKLFRRNVGMSPSAFRKSDEELMVVEKKGDYSAVIF